MPARPRGSGADRHRWQRPWRVFAKRAGVYGAGFYVAVNSLALPLAFGDPTPWRLGFTVVYPSLVIHLAYGFTVALFARPVTLMGRSTASK